MILDKSAFGLLSIALTLVSILPYIWHTLKGEVRPHVFSWIIWGTATTIITVTQHMAGAGPGAWSAATSTVLSFVVVLIAFIHRSDFSITRSDWVAFIIGLAIIPVWQLTHDPLWASLLATAIDSMGYYPTFRKSWHKPHQELVSLYFVANLKHLASIAAMVQYSATALFMPMTMLIINVVLIALLFWRRHILATEVVP